MLNLSVGTLRLKIEAEHRPSVMKELRRIEQSLSSLAVHYEQAARRIAVAAAAIGVPISMAVKSFATYEFNLSRVKAITEATEGQMATFDKAMRLMGRHTVFSAVEASEALSELAKAGIKPNEMLQSMLAISEMAAAGQLKFVEATDFVIRMLRGAGLEFQDLGRAVDVLTKAELTSVQSMQDIANAFKYAAPAAKLAGLSFEELTAAIQILADQGLRGEMGGTILRTGLLRLAKPSREAQREFELLNIEIGNAEGNFKSLAEIIGDLEDRVKQMGASKDALEFIARIFTARTAQGFAALVRAGGKELREKSKDLKDVEGYAKRVAAISYANLLGDYLRLRNAVIDLGLAFSRGLGPYLSVVASGLRFLSRILSTLVEQVPYVSRAIGVLLGVMTVSSLVMFTVGAVTKLLVYNLKMVRAAYVGATASAVAYAQSQKIAALATIRFKQIASRAVLALLVLVVVSELLFQLWNWFTGNDPEKELRDLEKQFGSLGSSVQDTVFQLEAMQNVQEEIVNTSRSMSHEFVRLSAAVQQVSNMTAMVGPMGGGTAMTLQGVSMALLSRGLNLNKLTENISMPDLRALKSQTDAVVEGITTLTKEFENTRHTWGATAREARVLEIQLLSLNLPIEQQRKLVDALNKLWKEAKYLDKAERFSDLNAEISKAIEDLKFEIETFNLSNAEKEFVKLNKATEEFINVVQTPLHSMVPTEVIKQFKEAREVLKQIRSSQRGPVIRETLSNLSRGGLAIGVGGAVARQVRAAYEYGDVLINKAVGEASRKFNPQGLGTTVVQNPFKDTIDSLQATIELWQDQQKEQKRLEDVGKATSSIQQALEGFLPKFGDEWAAQANQVERYTQALETLRRSLEEGFITYEDFENRLRKLGNIFNTARDMYIRNMTAAERYAEGVKTADQALRAGLITNETYNRELSRLAQLSRPTQATEAFAVERRGTLSTRALSYGGETNRVYMTMQQQLTETREMRKIMQRLLDKQGVTY